VRRGVAGLALLPVLATLAGGCGTPSADLFVVNRSGTIPGAKLKLLVSDGGTVRCNDGDERELGDARLLDARELARDLQPYAKRDLSLPPGPKAVLTYRVLLADGTVRFSDTSRGQPLAFRRLAAFTRDVAIHVCKLAR